MRTGCAPVPGAAAGRRPVACGRNRAHGFLIYLRGGKCRAGTRHEPAHTWSTNRVGTGQTTRRARRTAGALGTLSERAPAGVRGEGAVVEAGVVDGRVVAAD